jgi:hypothetical protein
VEAKTKERMLASVETEPETAASEENNRENASVRVGGAETHLCCFIVTNPVLRILDVLSRIRIPNFFDPGSGSRIRGVKKHRIPDLGSWILLYIKIGMKNKTNFFLAFYSFRCKFY